MVFAAAISASSIFPPCACRRRRPAAAASSSSFPAKTLSGRIAIPSPRQSLVARTHPLFLPASASSSKAARSSSAPAGDGERSPFKNLGDPRVWVPIFAVLTFFAAGRSLAAVTAAASDSIRSSGLGLKVALALRHSGWADEAIVFAIAALPVLELRGAIPVGYWMQLDPLRLTVISVLGNMVPVPLIIVFLKRLVAFASRRSAAATRLFDLLISGAREKAAPVEEFRWLGLMLFVAVPFPGTGAWTGAIVASILDMPYWSAVSANFVGVVLAGLLVNLLVNLGVKYAIATGFALFIISTFMWSILRRFKKSFKSL